MTTTEVLRVIVMVSSLTGLLICFAIAWRYPQIWLYTIPPALVLLNLILFTTARLLAGPLLQAELIQLFNKWSYFIQLQVAFTIGAIGGFYLWIHR